MSSRLSPRGEEPSTSSSPTERSARRRSSAKSWLPSGSQKPAQPSPTSSEEPQWVDPNDADHESSARMGGGRNRASFSAQTKDRRSSSATTSSAGGIPFAPPTAEDDSFFDEDDPQKAENVLGNWHFAPLLIAVLPPLGAVLGGQADAWSDAILLLLASFWLYQFLRVPHDIYHAARTRRILQADADAAEEEAERLEGTEESYVESAQRRKERAFAAAELRRAETFSLIALVLSPLLGAWLLTWMMEVFTDGNRYLNKFNIRLFMLASGIKPWSHAISLFRQRLLHLQEVVHYPSSRVEALNRRIARMESDLSTLRKLVATKSDVSLLRDGIDLPLTQLSRTMRRYERKEEHLRMSAEDKFSLVESRLEDLLREVAINAELIEEERRERQRAATLPASIFQALRYAFGQRRQEQFIYTPEGQRVLTHTSSLGITAHANEPLSPGAAGKLASGGTISASSSTSSTSDVPPTYSSPPRYGASAVSVSNAPQQQSSPPGWTEEGLAYWVFLPINIPRSVIRGALSYAGGRYNAAGSPAYTQTYAAAMNAASGNTKGSTQVSPHHRLTSSASTNSKTAHSPYLGERRDHRPATATGTPVNAGSHFSRRV